MDRASRLAAIRGDSELESEWAATADEVKEDILGNFPQAFSHLALIQAAARIIVAEAVQEFRGASSFSGSSAGGGGIRIHERPDGP
jgi:hypothetical protein